MRVLLTIDVEAHRVLDEISGQGRDSLARILALFSAHGLRGTFFVDLCEVDTWGSDVMRRTCDTILLGGHDLQLHAHPHHSSGDSKRWLLSEYSQQEQKTILDKAIERYQAYTGTLPHAFRAGGFGVNDATIDLLRSAGVSTDCSFMWGSPGCNITPSRKSVPTLYRGITEIPMTPIIALGTAHMPLRIAPLDFNWQPLFVLKDALSSLRYCGTPVAVLLLHSSSMYVRIGARRLLYRPAHEQKLAQLLEFIHLHGIQPVTISEATRDLELVANDMPNETFYVTRSLAVQYSVLLFQSVIGFGISARFRAFAIANVVLLAGVVYWLVSR